MNLRQTITQRLEKQNSVRQERREGFTDDNEAVYAELQRQLARPTQGQTSRPRRKPFDLRVQDPVARNSQDLSQETDTSIDFWESRFLDLDPASEHQQGVELKERAGRPMILIHQVAYPSPWRNLRPARGLLERICKANETQRAGRTIQMLRGAIRGGAIEGFTDM